MLLNKFIFNIYEEKKCACNINNKKEQNITMENLLRSFIFSNFQLKMNKNALKFKRLYMYVQNQKKWPSEKDQNLGYTDVKQIILQSLIFYKLLFIDITYLVLNINNDVKVASDSRFIQRNIFININNGFDA